MRLIVKFIILLSILELFILIPSDSLHNDIFSYNTTITQEPHHNLNLHDLSHHCTHFLEVFEEIKEKTEEDFTKVFKTISESIIFIDYFNHFSHRVHLVLGYRNHKFSAWKPLYILYHNFKFDF